MTFTSVITYWGVRGNQKVRQGTYTNTDGSTGGDIDTNLFECSSMSLTPTGATVSAEHNTINETLPVPGEAVTIVTVANECGTWEAAGY